jgi:hypothetical protein
MNYTVAKKQVALKRVVGVAVMLVSTLFVMISLLKFLYSSLGQGGAAFAQLSAVIQRGIYSIYEATQFLAPIWNQAPTPDLKNLLSSGTIGFLAWYVGVFVGVSLFRSGSRLAARLRGIDRQIEDELIRDSIRNQRKRTRVEIEDEVKVPTQSVWNELHTLYMAPILVGLVLLVVGKLLGLT